MIKIALIGIIAVILSNIIKGTNPQFSFYIILATALIVAGFSINKAKSFVEIITKLMGLLNGGGAYIAIILKISGLTYIGEFAAGICKESGHASLASQIEFALRITILVMSIPILTNMLEMIGNNL